MLSSIFSLSICNSYYNYEILSVILFTSWVILFQTGNSYVHVFFQITYIEEVFIRNIIIIVCNNYTI